MNGKQPAMPEQQSAEKWNRQADIFQHGILAGHLCESPDGGWSFSYEQGYTGDPVSLTLPYQEEPYTFPEFPSVFEGLLPEGPQLEALLRRNKIDRDDWFRQLITVGEDLVGSLTVFETVTHPASD